MFKKLQIISPAGAQSGGPESLHNLASLAKRLGFDVEMVYFPFREGYQVPDRYVFGCGMDVYGWWRNLPEVRALR